MFTDPRWDPKLRDILIIPFVIFMMAYLPAWNYGWAWDTGVIEVSLCLWGLGVTKYIIDQAWRANDDWKELPQVIEQKQIPDLNAYAYNVEQISMDDEKYVAHTLINMQHTAKVDLTEGYWIVGKRFGGSREQFALMLRDWEQAGAVQRKSRAKNNPYIVADWNKIRRIQRVQLGN